VQGCGSGGHNKTTVARSTARRKLPKVRASFSEGTNPSLLPYDSSTFEYLEWRFRHKKSRPYEAEISTRFEARALETHQQEKIRKADSKESLFEVLWVMKDLNHSANG
jgi:hypothetical protein